MSMLTGCTACGTGFRVTSEQLLAHQGKVRCGTCNTVFSALDNLVHTEADVVLADQVPTDGALPASGAIEDAGVHVQAASPRVSSVTSPESTTAALFLGPSRAALDDATLSLESLEKGPPDLQAPSDEVPAFVTEAAPVDAMAEEMPAASTVLAAAPQGVRFAWWSAAGALAALCGLALQGAYFYRDEIVTRFPETKPALAELCRQLACTFTAPRDAQAITIESHDLQAEPANKNVLALIALLRNRATYAQDVPHLELTLTDAQDAALARRVFVPREYAAAAQMAPNSELPVRIMLDSSQIKAAGYRLYAFYP